ncbi:MAG: hypothetical protein DA407_03145 [Bacteroidetes bacterium]|nr:MAG: hypothetical protein DA407_03145 [Bacteroidota bacterium]
MIYNSETYDSLGEAYFEAKNYEIALLNYEKVLKLSPNDKNAKGMIGKINKTLN